MLQSMYYNVMCRNWNYSERADEETAESDDPRDESEQPSFLNEESSTDTELLTDGGDDDEE